MEEDYNLLHQVCIPLACAVVCNIHKALMLPIRLVAVETNEGDMGPWESARGSWSALYGSFHRASSLRSSEPNIDAEGVCDRMKLLLETAGHSISTETTTPPVGARFIPNIVHAY
jgi:hypothetical protein